MFLSYNHISKLHVILHIIEKKPKTFQYLPEKQMCTKLLLNKEKYCTKFTEDLKVNTFPPPQPSSSLIFNRNKMSIHMELQ